MTKYELLAASAIALLAATPAFAQETPPDATLPPRTADPAQSTPSNTAPAEAVASEDDFQSANDIVVTATRRNETVQNVPVAITAVNAELLQNAGVDDVRGLEQLAPSLQTTTGQSAATGSSISIRGIGTAGDNPGFEPAVGVFIDGVFRSRAGTALAELPELERVEVLRGPQGTLFGRNTSGGALSIYTAKPQFDFGGYVEGEYGNFDAYSLKGGITGPVSEEFALRVDGGYRKRDGYITDINTGRKINNLDRYNVRGQALYDTSTFSVRLIGDYSETDEQCCGAVSAVRSPLYTGIIQSIAGARGRTGIYTGDPSDRIQAVTPERDYSERVRDYGASGEINVDIGDLKLTSITAYRNFRAIRNQDIDFSGVDRAYRDNYRTTLKDFTQELRLQGSLFDDKLDFLIGGFYLNEKLDLTDTVRFGADANRYTDTLLNQATRSAALPTGAQFYGTLPGVPLFSQVLLASSPALQAAAATTPGLFTYLNTPLTGVTAGQGNNNDNFGVKTDAFAIFTHNIVRFTDDLSATIGLRYNSEKKKLNASINSNSGTCNFFTGANPFDNIYRNAINSANAGLYRLFFLTACNPAINSEFNGSYRDEKTENALTGTAKLAYKFSNRILAYASYDRGFKSGGYNLDQASFDSRVLGGNGAQGSDLSFDRETVDAYELGLKTSLSRQFTLNLAGFYSKIKGLQSLIFSGNNFVVQNIDDASSKGVEVEAVIQPVRELVFHLGYTYNEAVLSESNNFAGTPLAGREGTQFGNVPKNVVTATATWTPRLTDTINGLIHFDGRFNSDVTLDATGTTQNDGYALVSGRIGLTTSNNKLGIEFFVENIFNQYYNVTGFAVPEQGGIPGAGSNYAVYPSPPRFYGVRARVGF